MSPAERKEWLADVRGRCATASLTNMGSYVRIVREDVPALLAEVEWLEKERAEFVEALVAVEQTADAREERAAAWAPVLRAKAAP